MDLLRDRRGAGGQRRGIVDLPGQPGPPRPVREPREPGRARSWWLRAPARARAVAVRPPLDDRLGEPHQRCRSSSPAPSRTSRPGPSGRRSSTRFPKTTPVFANMVNGGHIDSTDPQTISRWLEFLDIYVADKVPTDPSRLGRPHPRRVHRIRFGGLVPGPPPGHPVHERTEREDRPRRVRTPRRPWCTCCSTTAPAPPGRGPSSRPTRPTSPAGRRRVRSRRSTSGRRARWERPPSPARGGAPRSRSTPVPGPPTSLPPTRQRVVGRPGLGLDAGPGRRRDRLPDRSVHRATTIVGPATLDLWVRASTPVEDFQATVTEVAPLGRSGGVRDLGVPPQFEPGRPSRFDGPVHRPDLPGGRGQNLSPHAYKLVKIPIDPIAHTFRPGTELRVVISAPGGDRPIWEFDTLDDGADGHGRAGRCHPFGPGGQRGERCRMRRRPCRPATRCGASPAGPTSPRRTSSAPERHPDVPMPGSARPTVSGDRHPARPVGGPAVSITACSGRRSREMAARPGPGRRRRHWPDDPAQRHAWATMARPPRGASPP